MILPRATAAATALFFIVMFPSCASRNNDVTLLCLSSGSAPRFKQDILQTMALPRGGEIQFRYRDYLIPVDIQQRLESRTLDGVSVLLAYDDYDSAQTDPSGYGLVLPLRYGKLIDSTRVDNIYTLRFELEEFAKTDSVENLQKQLPPERRHLDPSDLNKKKAIGSLCLELPHGFQWAAPSIEISEWRKTITELAKHGDFKDQTYFLNIVGIFGRGSATPVELKNGESILSSENEYELKLFYVNPTWDRSRQEVQRLKVAATDSWLKVESPPVSLDSPYDLAPIRLRTPDPGLNDQRTLIMVHDRDPIQGSARLPVELYVPLTVKGTFRKRLAFGFILGILLTCQQMIAIFSSKELRYSKVLLFIAALVVGVGTGILLALGLPKPGG